MKDDGNVAKLGISEDFSAATKSDREFLKNNLDVAKGRLGKEVFDYGFLKYKTLVIKDTSGTFHNYYVNKVRSNPTCWLDMISGSQQQVIPAEGSSQEGPQGDRRGAR